MVLILLWNKNSHVLHQRSAQTFNTSSFLVSFLTVFFLQYGKKHAHTYSAERQVIRHDCTMLVGMCTEHPEAKSGLEETLSVILYFSFSLQIPYTDWNQQRVSPPRNTVWQLKARKSFNILLEYHKRGSVMSWNSWTLLSHVTQCNSGSLGFFMEQRNKIHQALTHKYLLTDHFIVGLDLHIGLNVQIEDL